MPGVAVGWVGPRRVARVPLAAVADLSHLDGLRRCAAGS
jgi:hypothetical protein